MSEEPPDSPQAPEAPGPRRPPWPRRLLRRPGASLLLGTGAGVVAQVLLFLLATGTASVTSGFTLWAPFVVYLLGAIVLAVRPRTSRLGAGLMIAIGVWLLIGAGVCVVQLTRGFA